MVRYYNLGLDVFFEIEEDSVFAYTFKDGELQTRNSVSENVSLLAEEVNQFEYRKQLDRRIMYFGKKFK